MFKHFMKEEQVVRQDEYLLEAFLRTQHSPMDHCGDVVNIVVREA